MSNFPKRVVEGNSAPRTDEIWLDTSGATPVLKTHRNEEWVPVAGSSSGDDSGGDSETPPSIGFPFFLGKPVGFICWNDLGWWGNDLYASEEALLPLDGILSYCEAKGEVSNWTTLQFCAVIEYEEKYDYSSDTFVDNPSGYLGSLEVYYSSSANPHWQFSCGYGCNYCGPLHIGDKKYSVQLYVGD